MSIKVGDLIPIGAIGNAKAKNVLSPHTFSSDDGVDIKGTMVNRGSLFKELNKDNPSQKINEGYYSGGEITAKVGYNIGDSLRVDQVEAEYTTRLGQEEYAERKYDSISYSVYSQNNDDVFISNNDEIWVTYYHNYTKTPQMSVYDIHSGIRRSIIYDCQHILKTDDKNIYTFDSSGYQHDYFSVHDIKSKKRIAHARISGGLFAYSHQVFSDEDNAYIVYGGEIVEKYEPLPLGQPEGEDLSMVKSLSLKKDKDGLVFTDPDCCIYIEGPLGVLSKFSPEGVLLEKFNWDKGSSGGAITHVTRDNFYVRHSSSSFSGFICYNMRGQKIWEIAGNSYRYFYFDVESSYIFRIQKYEGELAHAEKISLRDGKIVWYASVRSSGDSGARSLQLLGSDKSKMLEIPSTGLFMYSYKHSDIASYKITK